MTTRQKPKTFDCIEFKREAQAQIYGDIQDLSPQQQLDYYTKRAETGTLGAWWKSVKSRTSTEAASRKIAPPAS